MNYCPQCGDDRFDGEDCIACGFSINEKISEEFDDYFFGDTTIEDVLTPEEFDALMELEIRKE